MGVLDDLTLEKVINDNGGAELDFGSKGGDAYDFHIIQTFYEIKKSKNMLIFSLVKFGKYERYDIRNWYESGSKPGKGISFTYEEIKKFYESIKDRQLDAYDKLCRLKYDSDKVHAQIFEQICLLSEYTSKGVKWKKEISIIDWGYGAKYDLRKWTDGYGKCGKGITLSFTEMDAIRKELRGIIE